MPNSMVVASEYGGDEEGGDEKVRAEGNNERGIRFRDHNSTVGLNGGEEERLPARVEVVGGRYPAIYNFRGSSSEVVFPMRKSDDGNFANLGPHTKDTELRLGLPELGSKAFTPLGRLPNLCILQGGRINQNLPGTQLNAFFPRCSLDFQIRPNSNQGPGYASKEEFKLKPMFSEFTTPSLPLFPLARSPAKRIFSETLPANAAGEPKPSAALSSTQFYMPAPLPASLFNFPSSTGGPQNLRRMNQTGAYGQFSGQAALSVNPPPADQKGNSAEAQPATGTPSEERAASATGWPPLRSTRRNFSPQQKISSVAAQQDAPPPPPPPPVQLPPSPPPPPVQLPPSPPPPPVAQPTTMFVKVNVEGVPFGRKIDLNAYNSYEELSVGLDEMFKESIPGPFSLRNGDYMLVYEDDEGDRMLVGDVPWRMFVTTVKRLRMIRSSEARGIGTSRGAA